MAKASAHSIGPNMTKSETVAGVLYLPFYVVLLSMGLLYGAELLGLSLTPVPLNGAYFVLNALFTWVLFGRFLVTSWRSIRFWDTVQAVILGFVLYYVLNVAVNFALQYFSLSVKSYNDDSMQALAQENYLVTVLCSVLLAPLTEEVLARGLIFGTVRKTSRIAAYAASMLFFSFIHVWQFIPSQGWAAIWPAAVLYVPASAALCWTYEKAGTVWAPVFLHMVCNAITLGLFA